MNPTNNLLWLVRREIWENRSLWLVPLIIAGVLLITTLFGGMHFDDGGSFWIGTGDGHTLSDLPPEHRARLLREVSTHQREIDLVITGAYVSLSLVQYLALGIVVFFYLLDSLLGERRDRSILFWKSLPVSDGEVVTSKALTALVAAPAFAIVVSAVTLPLIAAVAWLRLGEMPVSPWNFKVWLEVQGIVLGLVPMVVLWYLPIAGYLMVVSAWARKQAFLWAMLPPISVLLIEALITHTTHMLFFLRDRFAGYGVLMGLPEDLDRGDSTIGEAYAAFGRVFGDWHIWAGVAAGLALIYVAIRIRRYRDDS